MDEQEAWQPKIFYSAGPDQGLPEPFPAPTHMKRKERSLHNRGTLFATADSNGRGSMKQDHRPKVPLSKRLGAHR